MKYCKECKYFNRIANTEETKQGICSFLSNYTSVSLDQDCPFLPHELCCRDCDRFGNDTACMTACDDDAVDNCPGFIDKQETIIEEAIMNLLFQDRFSREKIDNIINDCINNFKNPK